MVVIGALSENAGKDKQQLIRTNKNKKFLLPAFINPDKN